MLVLAFDLGGTRLKQAVIDDDGGVHDFRATSVAEGEALDVLLDKAKAQQHHGASAVGLSVPGLVQDGRSVSLPGKHPGVEGTDLARVLREAVSVPAFVVNDAVAYAAGECASGAARGAHRAVVVTIGTGVGVCVVENGTPLGEGIFGGGILGGKIPIADGSEHPDTSGHHGTIEALCAAQCILDGAEGEFARVEDITEAAHRGHPVALLAIERWRSRLVDALVALAHAHAPEVIVVGGGPMVVDTPLLVGVEQRMAARLFPGLTVCLRRAELGDAAALVGVAHLARRALGDD